MDLSDYPLWTIIVIVGALIAVGLQLRLLRQRGIRGTWVAVIPLIISAAAGAGFADRFEPQYPWHHEPAKPVAACPPP
jgi:hypothetical protein